MDGMFLLKSLGNSEGKKKRTLIHNPSAVVFSCFGGYSF